MRVLYLSPFFEFGGATRSLIEVMRAMDPDQVDMTAVVAPGVPQKDWFPDYVQMHETSGLMQWDNTRFSGYRGLRWLILLREFANYWSTRRTVQQMLALHQANPFDIIHCNEITMLPSAIMFKKALNLPLVMHVRSVQAGDLAPRRTKFINRAMERHVDMAVAIDQAVYRTLDISTPKEIIHNSVTVPDEYQSVALHDDPLTFGIIGSLMSGKGVMELMSACRKLDQRGVPFRLLVAGKNVRDLKGAKGWFLKRFKFASDMEADMIAFIEEYGLQSNIEMLGFIKDVDKVFAQLDVLSFASNYDAPGRPVFEAALHGVPSIVAQRVPTVDVFEDNVTGLRIDRPDPDLIADAMQKMHDDRAHTHQMGQTARQRAVAQFDSRVTAEKLTDLYRRVLGRS